MNEYFKRADFYSKVALVLGVIAFIDLFIWLILSGSKP